jgi:hypothetical protein
MKSLLHAKAFIIFIDCEQRYVSNTNVMNVVDFYQLEIQ